MGEERNPSFKCLKVLLIVLYVIALIYAIVVITVSIYGLALIGLNDGSNGKKLTPGEKEDAKNLFIGAIIYNGIEFIFAIIGLFGIIKENKCIVILITVLSVIGVAVYVVLEESRLASASLAESILTGVYAYMINKNLKGSNAV